MPTFRCLGKSFYLTQAELGHYPSSVLAEAWSASTDKDAVSLDTWPEPNTDVLEVKPSCLGQEWSAGAHTDSGSFAGGP